MWKYSHCGEWRVLAHTAQRSSWLRHRGLMKRMWTRSRTTWDPIPIWPLVNSTSEEMQGIKRIKPAGCLQPASRYSQGATSQGSSGYLKALVRRAQHAGSLPVIVSRPWPIALKLVWGLKQFSNSNGQTNCTGILLKCRSRFRRSRVGPEICISNKLPGDADAPGLQTKCGEARI